MEPGQLPTAERRARAYVDDARAWNAHGNLDQATNALNRAFTCAPQELQRPSVRDLITTMLDAPGPDPGHAPCAGSPRRSLTAPQGVLQIPYVA